MVHCKQQTSSKYGKGPSSSDSSLFPSWPQIGEMEATETLDGPKHVTGPLHLMEWDPKLELGDSGRKLILLLQPLKGDISWKDVLCMKCHVSLHIDRAIDCKHPSTRQGFLDCCLMVANACEHDCGWLSTSWDS